MWAEREWSDVRPGDYVQSLDGRIWYVTERNALGEVMLADQALHGVVNAGKQSGKVWVWDAAMEAAVTTIAGHLGGQVLADTTRRKA